MKRTCIVVSGLLFAGSCLAQGIQPNSTFFQVQDYYYPKPNGDYEYYQVAGYRQVQAPNVVPTIFLLPTITIRKEDIKFYRDDGTSFDPTTYSSTQAGLISIKPTYYAGMPNQAQIPGIASSLEGQSIFMYRFPPLKNGNAPVMFPAAAGSPQIRSQIEQDYAAYEAGIANQEQLAAKYNNFQKRTATLTDVEVRLMIGGEVAASRTYPGSVSTLGQIDLMAPTKFQANQIKEGNFEVVVVSHFRDVDTKFIQAHFDAKQAIDSFVEETQSALTKSRSSGFQVFGIGSRRSKMSTSINSSLRTNDHVQEMDNTRIVMYDASEDMIDEFESKFFPSLSQQDVIDEHLKAAAEAEKANNLELGKIHRDYAAAIQTGDQMKEVDSVAAAAALNRGDYAGFLAHGVRAIDSNNRMANNFRRLESRSVVIDQATNWEQTRQVTVNREVAVPVLMEASRKYVPRVGICGVRQQVDYTWWELNSWGYPQAKPNTGLMVSCVEAGSPAAQAGLIPGMLVRSVGTRDVSTSADLETAFADVEPGEAVSFYIAQPPSPASPISTERRIVVTSKRGPAL